MKKIIAFMLAVFFLAACSSDDNDDSSPATRTGVFKDSNVSGLEYISGSQSGVTDSNGEFIYEVGQEIEFLVGGVSLGTASPGDVITPVDLVPGGNTSSTEVQNIVRFLMMLDDDGDPANGINIPPAVQTASETWSQVDFKTGDLDTVLAPIVMSAVAASGLNHALPDMISAQNHMEATLRCTYAGAYKGSFGGDDNGVFGLVVAADTGYVSGIAYSEGYDEVMGLDGSTPIGYGQSPSFVSGSVYGGGSFRGRFDDANSLSGEWNGTDNEEGTFSGRRIGGSMNAKYRFTGQFSGDAYGVIAFDIDSANAVTGIAYAIGEESEETLTGRVTGNLLQVQLSGGVTASASIDLSTGVMTGGEWTDSAEGSSGTFSGCGCRLN